MLGLIILFVIFVRVRLLDVPLERDEGEYAYMGQLILQGVPPYSEAYNMKLPGTNLMYALIMSVFGQSTRGIHAGLMITNCAAILLVFLLGRRIMNDSAALAAAASYAVLSLDPSVYGFAAHATHFVVLPALAGTLLLISGPKNGGRVAYFWSGVLFGLAFVMKQPGIFFLLFGGAWVVYTCVSAGRDCPVRKLVPDLLVFSIGGVLPVCAVVVWIYLYGNFDKFWFWTFQYASGYASQVPLSEAFSVFRSNVSQVTGGFVLVWLMALAGFVTVFVRRGVTGAFLGLFVFCSFLSICPGFYFRPHYFITLLPAVALSVGAFVDFTNARAAALSRWRYAGFMGAGIFVATLLFCMVFRADYYFREDPVGLSRDLYDPSPFPESVEVAKYIASRSSASDRVAVFGSEPQIFFYSGRRSATGYIYTYSLMEDHRYALTMQKEMIDEIEASRPKFIVDVHVQFSWLVRPASERHIFRWFNAFVKDGYTLVGIVDRVSPGLTIYKWNEEVAGYAVQSPSYLLVYERK
jgi:4-amino-4-deoxy-L-arabinose transferase-like glycosyltransferase